VEQGNLDGDISEVVFYGKELSGEERESIHAYLEKKYGAGLTRFEEPTLDGAFEKLPAYRIGQGRAALGPIDAALAASHGDAGIRADLERRLIAVLRSKATRDARDFVCRRLGIYGTENCVPALGRLLTDPELSHLARIALERISGPSARRAFREAFPKVRGRARVGLINSLGRMEDGEIVPALISSLKDPDPEIAAASAVALGRIGSAAAAGPLEQLRRTATGDLALAAAEASLELADRLLKQGRRDLAASIWNDLQSNGPEQMRAAARKRLGSLQPEESRR